MLHSRAAIFHTEQPFFMHGRHLASIYHTSSLGYELWVFMAGIYGICWQGLMRSFLREMMDTTLFVIFPSWKSHSMLRAWMWEKMSTHFYFSVILLSHLNNHLFDLEPYWPFLNIQWHTKQCTFCLYVTTDWSWKLDKTKYPSKQNVPLLELKIQKNSSLLMP